MSKQLHCKPNISGPSSWGGGSQGWPAPGSAAAGPSPAPPATFTNHTHRFSTNTLKCCRTFTGLIHEKGVILSSTPKGNICKPKTKQTSLFLDFSQHLSATAYTVFKARSPPVAPNCWWRRSLKISKFYSPHLKWVLHWETGENSLKCV